MRHHTGQYRWILDRGVPRYAPDGTFEGYVGGCLDIHGQKEAAQKLRIADDMTRLMKAQDEERRRIARELHDSAGQTLTVLGLSIAQMVERASVIAPDLAKEGKEIEGVVRQLHREIRTTSYLLHPPLLDECGLASALTAYIEGLAERSHLAITLNVAANVGRLPSDMELAIFRVVQECLTNIHRHSGSKTALIRVAREGESIRTEVQDHGKGMSPGRLLEVQSKGSGVGIAGIRERMRLFHGELKIESNGSGTSVIVTIPMSRKPVRQNFHRSESCFLHVFPRRPGLILSPSRAGACMWGKGRTDGPPLSSRAAKSDPVTHGAFAAQPLAWTRNTVSSHRHRYGLLCMRFVFAAVKVPA